MTAARAILILICTATLARASDGEPWAPPLLRDEARWRHDPADESVRVTPVGLRVAVPEGKTWRIAAANSIRLPERVGTIRVRVAEVGGDGEWLMRVYGDVRGEGRQRTVGFFQGERRTGAISLSIDPRLLPRSGEPPLQVQLGLEGPPGAHVVFESLEFLPAPERPPADGRPRQEGQLDIECVTLMPQLPEPFEIRDWKALARGYDELVFDFEARGEYLPLIWIDETGANTGRVAFGLPSYVGDPNRSGGPHHEGITCMGSVLGATVAGIDKRRQLHDYVLMCEAYYNKDNDERLVLNGVQTRSGGSYWYEIWPHIVFYALADRYPGAGSLDEIVRTTAERWLEACRALDDGDGVPDFDHTAFRFATMEPVDNGKWKEPDAAAGVAWLQYMAWVKLGRREHLHAAEGCLQFLERRATNPYYEVLLPYGALTAARMNAELGHAHDVSRLLEWCFGISECRGGWGVIATRWHGYDCHGLLGSVDNRGGYAFAMNTFAQAAALGPLVRYDERYARAIGKWMLNLTNAARLFYPGALPEGHESSAFWKGDPEGVVAYEGLRHEWDGKGPYATGDPVLMKWGPETDRGLYGSGYVGLLAGIVERTNEPRILRLDCRATDFFGAPSYPTFLYYNPHDEPRIVEVPIDDSPRDLYDACSGSFLRREATSISKIPIPADGAVLLVLPPSGGKVTRSGTRMLVEDVVVDYRT